MLRFDFIADNLPAGPLIFDDPVSTITATSIDEVMPALEAVSRAAENGLWAAGYVAYEAAPAFDTAFKTRPPSDLPLVWFGLYSGPSHVRMQQAPQTTDLPKWYPEIERSEYERCVESIREATGRGDLYQANYTFPLTGKLSGDTYAAYCALQRSSGCRYGAYLDIGGREILSLSPELYFQIDERAITTRPMKGTCRRGRWAEEDDRFAEELAGSAKDRAENLMIVDLLRNDLGRIGVPGSVQTNRLFDLERYPTVWQMTSTIEAVIRDNIKLPDLFQALFPCGSVTGAPKIAAMQKIAELERAPRGVYCGAIGLVRPGGNCTFNVSIRTMAVESATGNATYGVGGGITWDSAPAGEYNEALAKALVLRQSDPEFELLETLRLEAGSYSLEDRHIYRILRSARYFGIPLDPNSIAEALDRCAGSYPDGCWRVRILGDKKGCVRAETAPHEPVTGVQSFDFANASVDSADRFLYHKTTNRSVFRRAFAGMENLFDVLLTNERGEITEFTRGNLVVGFEGEVITPPIYSGLLAGTFRQELLDRGEIIERIVMRELLLAADRIWHVNSVNGWVQMVYCPQSQELV